MGVTSVTMSFIPAVKIVQDAKKNNPDIITFMGGPHVSFDFENTLEKYPELDLILVGEGEGNPEGAYSCDKGQKRLEKCTWNSIQGKRKVVFTGARPLIEKISTLFLFLRDIFFLYQDTRPLDFP